jgi:hypothetical protein
VVVEQIRRGVPYESSTGKYPYFQQFASEDFDAADGDVKDLYTYMISTHGNIVMAMYALSYGKQDGLLLDLYSDAVYLGSKDVYFGW